MARHLAVRQACWLDRPKVSDTHTDSPKLPPYARLHPSCGLCGGSGSREAPQHCALRRVAGGRTWRRHPCRKASSPSTPGALPETDDVGDPADPFPVLHHDGQVHPKLNRAAPAPSRAKPRLFESPSAAARSSTQRRDLPHSRDRRHSGETNSPTPQLLATLRYSHGMATEEAADCGGGYSAACPSCC